METLDSTPDTTFLHLAADPDRHRVLERLVEGPATQKQLATELGLYSGTISKQMAKLSDARLVQRKRPHAPYELLHRSRVAELLQANANLAREVADAASDAAKLQQQRLNKAVMQSARQSHQSEIA